jgi:hypothetical protein
VVPRASEIVQSQRAGSVDHGPSCQPVKEDGLARDEVNGSKGKKLTQVQVFLFFFSIFFSNSEFKDSN